MIDKEKYNERLQEIIDSLENLKIGDRKMWEHDRVTCLGGVSVMLEDLGEDTQYEMAIAKPGVKPEDWKSQKEIDEMK